MGFIRRSRGRASRVVGGSLVVAFAGLLMAGCGRPDGPSIVLVTIDTARADAFGVYGGRAETPIFDQLASEGSLYTSALTPVPITLPAHTSLLTGLLPAEHGVRDNGLFRLDAAAQTLAEVVAGAGYDTAAFVSAMVLGRSFGLAQGFDVYDDGELSVVRVERRAADTVSAAIDYLDGRSGRRPFFLWVHLFDPHQPFEPPGRFAERFAGEPYLGEISYADAELGRLVEAARAVDPATRFVVTSDHGEGLRDHGEMSHGIFLYQSTVRVPLVVAGGELPAGQRVDTPTSLASLYSTIARLAGAVTLPQGTAPPLAGLWQDEPGSSEPILLETLLPYHSYGWSPLYGMVARGRKVVEAPRPELYDLDADATETADLSTVEPELLDELLRELRRRRGRLTTRWEAGTDLTPDTRRALESLGYLAESREPATASARDPKDMVGLLDRQATLRTLLDNELTEQAVAAALAILADFPENVRVREMLAQGLMQLGRTEEAVRAFETVLETRPDRIVSQAELGLCYHVQGRFDAAAERYEKALALDERYGRAHLLIGNLHWDRGEPERARPHYERYLELDPSQPDLAQAVRARLVTGGEPGVEAARQD